MEKLNKFLSWWNTVIGACYVGVALHLKEAILSHNFSDKKTLVVLVCVAIFTLKIGSALGNEIVRSVRLLRKIILGKDFIEGYWIDLNIDDENKVLRAISLVFVDYEDGSLVMGGEIYSCGGASIGNWRSTSCGYKNLILWYVYSREVVFKKKEKAKGRGELCFTTDKGSPKSYYGSFYDTKTETEISVEGIKVTSRQEERKLTTAEGRKEIVKAYVSQFLQNHKNYSILDNV